MLLTDAVQQLNNNDVDWPQIAADVATLRVKLLDDRRRKLPNNVTDALANTLDVISRLVGEHLGPSRSPGEGTSETFGAENVGPDVAGDASMAISLNVPDAAWDDTGESDNPKNILAARADYNNTPSLLLALEVPDDPASHSPEDEPRSLHLLRTFLPANADITKVPVYAIKGRCYALLAVPWVPVN